MCKLKPLIIRLFDIIRPNSKNLSHFFHFLSRPFFPLSSLLSPSLTSDLSLFLSRTIDAREWFGLKLNIFLRNATKHGAYMVLGAWWSAEKE